HNDRRVWRSTYQSGNINTNNNRRQVEPLQAIAPGPAQAIVFTGRSPRQAGKLAEAEEHQGANSVGQSP
ncbi:MAG: hypothetical protein ACYC91_15175, partial [Solirubrobacteraceae bacterium]